MGFTFKENCGDLRNTLVSELVLGLKEYDCSVDIFDPWVDIKEAKKTYNYNFISSIKASKYDSLILAVAHNKIKKIGSNGIACLGLATEVNKLDFVEKKKIIELVAKISNGSLPMVVTIAGKNITEYKKLIELAHFYDASWIVFQPILKKKNYR